MDAIKQTTRRTPVDTGPPAHVRSEIWKTKDYVRESSIGSGRLSAEMRRERPGLGSCLKRTDFREAWLEAGYVADLVNLDIADVSYHKKR
ncbi:hypothetical protein MBLNU457_g1133t1 [Dothideomycetes sp. NU457]